MTKTVIVDETYFRGLQKLERTVGRTDLTFPEGQYAVERAYREIERPAELPQIEGWAGSVRTVTFRAGAPRAFFSARWRVPRRDGRPWLSPTIEGPSCADRNDAIEAGRQMLRDLRDSLNKAVLR